MFKLNLLQFSSEFFETCHNDSPRCPVVHLGLRILIAVCVLKLSPLISEIADFSL